MVPDPVRFDWTGVPCRVFLSVKGLACDVEAALGPRHRLTETAARRDLATLNGRGRGTKDFLGRVSGPHAIAPAEAKADAIDPVDVLGAASTRTPMLVTSLRRERNRRQVCCFPGTREKKVLFFRIPR